MTSHICWTVFKETSVSDLWAEGQIHEEDGLDLVQPEKTTTYQ